MLLPFTLKFLTEEISNGEFNERSSASTSIPFIKIHIFPLSECDIRGFYQLGNADWERERDA